VPTWLPRPDDDDDDDDDDDGDDGDDDDDDGGGGGGGDDDAFNHYIYFIHMDNGHGGFDGYRVIIPN